MKLISQILKKKKRNWEGKLFENNNIIRFENNKIEEEGKSLNGL